MKPPGKEINLLIIVCLWKNICMTFWDDIPETEKAIGAMTLSNVVTIPAPDFLIFHRERTFICMLNRNCYLNYNKNKIFLYNNSLTMAIINELKWKTCDRNIVYIFVVRANLSFSCKYFNTLNSFRYYG